MTSLGSAPLDEVLTRLAARTPAPGGGAAAAIAGALGAALAQMVASLPRTRHDTVAERARLDEAAVTFSQARLRFVALADEDSAAVLALVAASKTRAEVANDQRAASHALATAAATAARVPVETARTAAGALAALRAIAPAVAAVALSDAEVAVGLLVTAAEGAAANVRVNLVMLDAPMADALRAVLADTLAAAANDALAVRKGLVS